MSNVCPIQPGILVPERSPDGDVIELLEDMLAMAQAGEIIGFNGAILFFDGVAARRRAGSGSHALAGACFSAIIKMQMEK
jgi:hypothetical protein